MGKPIEREPKNYSKGLPPFWYARQNFGIPYRPTDEPQQEDWYTVARKFAVDVKYLIYFNFQTNEPDEVNWYLKRWVGCEKVSPSGNNYMFSKKAKPGWIWIPPMDDTEITFEGEEHCAWTTDGVRLFLLRLKSVAQQIPGHQGQRIRRLVEVIRRVGYPDCLKLWYYNEMNIRTYVDIKTTWKQLKEMTKHTNGAFPFDGLSGLYSQAGTYEMHRGYWRIHAVRDLFEEFGCTKWEEKAIQSRLESIDRLMFLGWREMSMIDFKTTLGGGNAYHESVEWFIRHVTALSRDERHLYWAFGS